MQFRTTGLLLLGAMALPASGAAQTTAAPPAITRAVIAATKLPTVADVPLHFKAVSITLQPDEKSSVSAANGILYQMSGTTEVSLGGEAKMLDAGAGLFIAGGETAVLTAGSGGPSTLLHFFLAPAVDLGRLVETAPAAVRELYRTATPIPDLKPGGYDLNLTRVTFPAQMPSNPPHHRSGAALYYIISGTGANSSEGIGLEHYPGNAFDSLDHRLRFEYGACSGEPKAHARCSNHALARIAKGGGPVPRGERIRLKKPAKTREELESAIRMEMEDICEWPTDLAISVVPHEDSWKVEIMTDGPQDADRCDMIQSIADRLRGQFDLKG